jgi:pSer/pThr/pTyr-binding forkhead associated (FHA) protein
VARIVVTLGDMVLREMRLSKERISIGRRPHNDIVIDDLAISAEHAVIVTARDESYLEDLNSTNGTQINGRSVKKHYLQDDDVIELAQYKIRYLFNESVGSDDISGLDMEYRKPQDQSFDLRNTIPVIKVLNGIISGKEVVLIKTLTTIGWPGQQVAVIKRHMQNYFIKHVEGDRPPLVNGKPIGRGDRKLAYGDVIDLSGTLIAFSRA